MAKSRLSSLLICDKYPDTRAYRDPLYQRLRTNRKFVHPFQLRAALSSNTAMKKTISKIFETIGLNHQTTNSDGTSSSDAGDSSGAASSTQYSSIIPFICPNCCVEFLNAHEFSAHLARGRCECRSFICPICKRILSTGVDLLSHVNEKHYSAMRKKPRLVCPYCTKAFKDGQRFVTHMFSSTCKSMGVIDRSSTRPDQDGPNQFPFSTPLESEEVAMLCSCPYCNQLCASETHLYRHMSQKHQ